MKKILVVVAAAALALTAAVLVPQSSKLEQLSPIAEAQAATSNASVGSSVMTFPFHVTGTTSSTVTGSGRFAMPMPCQLVGAGAAARTASGTLTVDVLAAGVTVMTSAIAINTSATWTEGTIGTPNIADETAVTFNLTPAGAGATFSDVTVLLTCVRR